MGCDLEDVGDPHTFTNLPLPTRLFLTYIAWLCVTSTNHIQYVCISILDLLNPCLNVRLNKINKGTLAS